jgi:hypothetical protein
MCDMKGGSEELLRIMCDLKEGFKSYVQYGRMF